MKALNVGSNSLNLWWKKNHITQSFDLSVVKRSLNATQKILSYPVTYYAILPLQWILELHLSTWINLKNITLREKRTSYKKIFSIWYLLIKSYNMQTNTVYWSHLDQINGKPKFTTVVPQGWARTGMASRVGTHRASPLPVTVFGKCCDECMAATWLTNLFWMPGMFRFKPAGAARFAALRYTSRETKESGLWHWRV